MTGKSLTQQVTSSQSVSVPRASWLSNLIAPTIAFVVLIALWQLGVIIFKPQPFIVPSPMNVIEAFQERGSRLLSASWITFQGAAYAFLASSVIGALVALLLVSVPFLYKGFFPYTVILQAVPVVAVAPIIIIWFGIGMPAIVAIAVIISIFPIIANTVVGLRSTDAGLKQLFQLYDAKPWQTVLKLRLPAALPYFFTGLRIAAGSSVIGAIVGEYMAGMAGTRGGLGFLVVELSRKLQMSSLFATVICAAILGILFFGVVSWLSNLFLKNWHESARAE
ncbi:MAG: ABC transporter permease [Trueperaceae bacterium]